MKQLLPVSVIFCITCVWNAPSAWCAAPAPAPWTEMKVEKLVPIQKSSVAGTGKTPVIIIAELGCDETAYADFASRNADRFTTHTLVLPGTTPDTRPPVNDRGQVKDPIYLVNAVAAVIAYASDHKIEKPVVLGHGMGGTVAYMLAAQHPEFAAAYVVVDTLPALQVGEVGNVPPKDERATQVDKYERQSLLAMNQNVWLNRIRMVVPAQTSDQKRLDSIVNMMSNSPAHVVRRYMLEALYLDPRTELAASPAPILLYAPIPPWMRNVDKQVTRASFQNAVINRPGARLEVMDGSRHWVILDEPAKFDEPLLKFLGLSSDAPSATPATTAPEKSPEVAPDAKPQPERK